MITIPLRRRILVLLLLLYAAVAGLFAVYTPAWQVPDEPAHYNYIRHIAQTGQLPVLAMGDYDQQYLETIKARRFPPDLPVDAIRYEAWQPPLYYLLATPVFLVGGGNLLALRLFSVGLGLGVVLLAYRVSLTAFPQRGMLALAAAAFVAFLPQHVAMLAGVNNDALAELLLGGILLLTLCHVRGTGRAREMPLLGILLGLGFLTKGTTYIAAPWVALAILWRARHDGQPTTILLRRGLITLAPTFLLGLPWWLRNLSLYGGTDFLGSRWHDLVVFDQPRTADWLAQFGLAHVLSAGLQTTFHSFWGQFGWMGVPMDGRVYAALLALCGVAAAGALAALRRLVRWRQAEPTRRTVVGLLLLLILFNLALFLWYNLTYVQHQGRYLFAALVPIAIAFAAGLTEAMQPRTARWLVWLTPLPIALTFVTGGDRWAMLFWLAAGVAVGVASRLPERVRLWLPLLVCMALAALDVFALFAFIVPQLAP